VQQFSLAFAGGASRVQVYKLRNTADHPESIEPFGLLRADDTPRPAFAAFQTATRYLGGFTAARLERQGDVVAVTFERGEATTTVLWSEGPSARMIRVRAIAPQALLVDERGQTQAISAVNGVYTVALPGALCSGGPPCRIGGAPRLLVEQGSAAGRTALATAVAPTQPTTSPLPAASKPVLPAIPDRAWRPARGGLSMR